MRIWKVPPCELSRQRLLGEHREIHAMLTVLDKKRKGIPGGYQKHPEVLKYEGLMDVLIRRHDQLSEEMKIRGYRHKSPVHLFVDDNKKNSSKPLCIFSTKEIKEDREELERREKGFKGRKRNYNWKGI